MSEINVLSRTQVIYVDPTSGATSVFDTGPPGITGAKGPPGDQGVKGDTGAGVPAGGTINQILQKTGAPDYSTGWTTPPAGLPAGGAAGDFLVKASATNYDMAWSSTLKKIADAQASGWYSFRAHRSTAYSIPGSASPDNTVVFNTEDYDHANRYDPATGIYSVPVAGVYHFDSSIQYSIQNNPEFMELALILGASTQKIQSGGNVRGATAGDALVINLTGDILLAANDQVKIMTKHVTGATAEALQISAPQRNWFTGHLVYPT